PSQPNTPVIHPRLTCAGSFVLSSVEKACSRDCKLLTRVILLLSHLMVSLCDRLCVYETSLFGALVSEDTLRGFFRHTLTHILTHQPRLRVSDAVAMQSQWSFAKAAPLLTSLFRKVCVLFSMEEVLVHLQQVLETLEVNWQNVLSCLSTLLVYHTHTQACLKEMLSRLLSSAFHTYDVEKMITAFLLARQGALEGLAVFPSYSDWFKMAFGGTSGYHGNSKKSLLFLMKFLSDLVPFDPPQYLKVHIMHPPYITGKHRALLQEYVSLAKTRLSDLKVSVDEMGLYEVVSGAVSECPAQWDVEKAVTLFQSTGRIPATVMEASIFRRPYFLTRFLPVLLMPRVVSVCVCVCVAEKIPASVFSSYSEACLRERQEGGTGENQSSSTLPTMYRYSYGFLSVCFYLTVCTKFINAFQVVDLVLRGFCQCVLDACRVSPPHRQGQWASMFLRMLVGQQKLYTALILRTFQLLHQGPSLAAAHVLGLAVFLVEMHACREVCPLVELLPCSLRSARMSPAEALSTALLSSTASHMQFSLRLSVAALCYARCRSISQREELNHWVPGRLHKQLLFLMPRLLPETRASVVTMVDGSVFSEGADEEECLSAWMSVTDSSGDVRSSVRAMWKHTAIRNLWSHPEHQLSFSEWLTAELKVQRSEDALSESERQVYERWVCLQWFLPLDVANGGCGGSSVTACKHIINAVLDTGSELLSAPEHTHSCRVDVLSRLQVLPLVWELEFVRIHRKTEREEGHFLWDLMAQRCSVTSDPENISIELELQRTLHTFNRYSVVVVVVFQRRVCCPAAALSCSLTGHFLSVSSAHSIFNHSLLHTKDLHSLARACAHACLTSPCLYTVFLIYKV
uniref:Fanconi anaemia group A protein N-terminal domain-containing protein n=1 Tax=Electrophorus electricus TaxID=8005 RepID=A0AAY5EI50_ELEEL